MIEQQGKAEIMRARAQAINYMVPMIESIYAQHMNDFGTPMSSNEVWAKLVGNIPFVATVTGMYALGAAGVDAAGDTINADHSIVNTNGVQAAHGSTAAGANHSGSDMSGRDMSTTTTTTTETNPITTTN